MLLMCLGTPMVSTSTLFTLVAELRMITLLFLNSGRNSFGFGASTFVASPNNNAFLFRVLPEGFQFIFSSNNSHLGSNLDSKLPLREQAQPVVDDEGTAFFVNGTHIVSVLYNGSVLWTFQCPAVTPYAVSTTTLFANGDLLKNVLVFVCVSTDPASLVIAVDAATGEETIWPSRVSYLSQIFAAPVFDTNNNQVIVVTYDGVVHALRALDGQPAWAAPAATNQAVTAAPCSDNSLWYVFTLIGHVFGIDAQSGNLVWNMSVTGTYPGFMAGCTAIPNSDGPAYVAAGSLDFSAYVILTDPVKPSIKCSYATDGMITEGMAFINGTLVVPSRDNSIHAFSPFLNCIQAFVVPNLPNPSRPAVSGGLLGYVGTDTGLVAFDLRWISLKRVAWVLNVTGEQYGPPSVCPFGTLRVTTRQGSLMGVGVTVAMIKNQYTRSFMDAYQTLGSLDAIFRLSYVCNTLNLALAKPFVTCSIADWMSIHNATKQACSTLQLVQGGQDPSGNFKNYADWRAPTFFSHFLQSDMLPLLAEVLLDVENLTNSAAADAATLKAAENMLGSYADREAQLQQDIDNTKALLDDTVDTISATETRLKITTELISDEITKFSAQWLALAKNFSQAALSDNKSACDQFKRAFTDFGLPGVSIKNPFTWKKVGTDFKAAMKELELAIQYMIKTAYWAGKADEYIQAWGQLQKVSAFFDGMREIDETLMQNNHTLPEVLPLLFQEAIDMDKIQFWMAGALSALKNAAGGAEVASSIEAFIADSKALAAQNLAYFAMYNQYQSLFSQMVGLQNAVQEIYNTIADETVHDRAVNAALDLAKGELLAVQVQVLQNGRRACQQLSYWLLKECPIANLLPIYPIPEDIVKFVTRFDQIVAEGQPAQQGNAWAELKLTRESNPESFAVASQGVFYVTISMPPDENLTFFNVRTEDYRAYFLPLTVEQPDIDVSTFFTHGGLSEFVNPDTKQHFIFAHHPFTDTSLFFKSQTEACPVTQHVCQPPQCSRNFDLSPYGVWKLQVNPGVFEDINAVKGIVIQFHLAFTTIGQPMNPYFFAGGDGSRQFPVCCCGCTQPC